MTTSARVCLLPSKGDYEHARFFLVDYGKDIEVLKMQCAKILGIELESSDDVVELRSAKGVLYEHTVHVRDGDDIIVHVVPCEGKTEGENTEATELLSDEKKKEPKVVTCSFFVNAVKALDAIEGTVEVDFQLYLSWVDEALIGVPVADRPPYESEDDSVKCCWNPQIEVNNDINLETLWSVYPPQYQGVEEGRVIWGARYRGNISNDMDL